MIKILGRLTSINVRKVIWTAELLRVGYEREDWGLPNRDPNVPEFLALNPNAQVPVLIDSEFVLWESHAIMRYLCRTRHNSVLLPDNEQKRALVEQWLGWQATDLNAQWGYAVMSLVRKMPGFEDEQQIANSLQRWAAKMAVMDAQIAKTSAFITGPEFTLADVALTLSAHRWFAVKRDVPEFKHVRSYYERALAISWADKVLSAATP